VVADPNHGFDDRNLPRSAHPWLGNLGCRRGVGFGRRIEGGSMRREIDHGIERSFSPQGGSNGFVNRRSPVQSRAPALGSENSIASTVAA
jgi:hypothetical protein